MIETYLFLMIHKPQSWVEMPPLASRGPMSSGLAIFCFHFRFSAFRAGGRGVSRKNSGHWLWQSYCCSYSNYEETVTRSFSFLQRRHICLKVQFFSGFSNILFFFADFSIFVSSWKTNINQINYLMFCRTVTSDPGNFHSMITHN